MLLGTNYSDRFPFGTGDLKIRPTQHPVFGKGILILFFLNVGELF